MKKLIFYSIVILVFLAGCTPFEPDEANYKQAAVPVPAPDQTMTNVTVYLNGNEPPESRAMNKTLAEMGCDYFEVVFVWKDNTGASGSARGQWRIGEKAGVKDVYTGAGGSVDYGSVSDNLTTNNTGSAMLLAGKSDKTLMAVGKLPTGTTINANTTSVTFDVAAFKTGVSETLASSSFLTAVKDTPTYSAVSQANTETSWEEIETIYFLAFNLVQGQSAIKAQYTFKLDYSGTNQAGILSTYTSGGLRVKSAGIAEKKHPSYTTSEGDNINVNALIILDKNTGVAMDNNQTSGYNFNPVVNLSFDTRTTTGGSIFALVFEIPVYVLGQTDCVWYIKPGYGVLKYELDEGLNGMGGAVLIKTGEPYNPPVSTNFKIEVKQVPRKWRYRWAGASGETANDLGFVGEAEYDRVFRITGLSVQLQHENGDPFPDFGDSSVNTTTAIIANTALTFIIGGQKVRPIEQAASGYYVLPDEFYGLIEVTVRYIDPSSLVYSDDKFLILASGHYSSGGNNSTSAFDYANPTYMATSSAPNGASVNTSCIVTNVDDENDLLTLSNAPVNRLRIYLLSGSFNIAEPALNITNSGTGQSLLCMFLATGTNVILGRKSNGRGGGTQILIRGNRAGLAAFYFGTWPFTGLPRSPSLLNGTTKPFSVNAAGTASSSFPLSYNNKMIVDGNSADQSGGIYNVILDERRYGGVIGVDVHHPNLLH